MTLLLYMHAKSCFSYKPGCFLLRTIHKVDCFVIKSTASSILWFLYNYIAYAYVIDKHLIVKMINCKMWVDKDLQKMNNAHLYFFLARTSG